MESLISFDPAQQPPAQPDTKSPGTCWLVSLIGRVGASASAFLLAQVPRLLGVLLLRSLGVAFDQQVLRWMALGAGDLW